VTVHDTWSPPSPSNYRNKEVKETFFFVDGVRGIMDEKKTPSSEFDVDINIQKEGGNNEHENG
jgi:hypothetical protein